ncbi:hypothetical protein HZA57_07260 [Candidatus Poribacteria bacterium]|nr:hypothetical protein [Candidatus Poribacteria bacterium]
MAALMGALLLLAGVCPAETDAPTSPTRTILNQPAQLGSPSAGPVTEPAFCAGVGRGSRLVTPVIVAGEPLAVDLILQGVQTESPVGEREFLAQLQYGRDVEVAIYPETGRSFRIEGIPRLPETPNTALSLGFGETAQVRMLLAYDFNSLSGAVFEKPGNYQIEFTLRCHAAPGEPGDGETQSLGRMTVKVKASEGDDATALEILDQPEYFQSIQLLRLARPSHRTPLERLVREARESALRPFALLALGLAEEAAGDAAGVGRAAAIYEQAAKEYPDHSLAETFHSRLLSCALRLEQREKARGIFAAMWQDPLLSRRFSATDPLRVQFLGPAAPVIRGEWMLWDRPPATTELLAPEDDDAQRWPDFPVIGK